MHRSDNHGAGSDETSGTTPGPGGIDPERPEPPDLIETWDPVDDEQAPSGRNLGQWSWHGRPSWGRRAVAAFPPVAVAVAIGLIAYTTVQAQGAVQQSQAVVGTGGATLLLGANTDQPSGADYHAVTFTQPSTGLRPIQDSTSLSLLPYVGWEVNGSAGTANGIAAVDRGALHVGVRHPTSDFRGWFLTATSPTSQSCAFQFSAASPPPVTASDATGELVMAVQTSDTDTTGDINYVVVAEVVQPDGRRTLEAGYALGHLGHASEHLLKRAPWAPGPLQVAIRTNGDNQLSVWINGSMFVHDTDLDMGIVPPFEPYLEVQARNTAYTVSYNAYSSVCQPDIVVSGLQPHTVLTLGNRSARTRDGSAVLGVPMSSPPLTGTIRLTSPGAGHTVTFASHTYWPGDRLSYQPG